MRRDRAYLVSIGSNVEPARWVPRGLAWLRDRFDVDGVSATYASDAVGPPGQPAFVNRALRLRTDLPPWALRVVCRHLEALCGRVREDDRFAPRPLDVDVVYEGRTGACLDPDLLAQAHVLVPCAEVWPEAVAGPEGRSLATEARARFPGWADAHRAEES